MDIHGKINTTCPPEIFLATMRDTGALLRVLPAGAQLTAEKDGALAFSMSKTFGPIRLTLPGQMSLIATGTGHDQILTARAAHVIGGKVDLDVTFSFERAGGKTQLAYTGSLTATGVAGRVLRDHHGRVNHVFRSLLLGLKLQAEEAMRPGNATPL